MTILRPISSEGYKLFHEGTLALSQVEHNGMRIDTKYLGRTIKKLDKKIAQLSNEMKESAECRRVYKTWRKRYGVKTNLGSHEQLGRVLFDDLKIKGKGTTKSGRWKSDKDALEDIDLPFVKKYLEAEKLKKARSTYLGGILREVDSNGFLHPVFNLHTVATYRSSVSDPNTQNIPIRDTYVASLVRPCFISRWRNGQIGEADFSGVEVRVSACYNKDPQLLTYIKDKTTDMHRDMGMECYKLSKSQMTKEIRYCAKNRLVFPFFYGDWFFSCAQSLWDAIDRMKLKTAQGTPLKEYLRKKGITKLGNLDPDKEPLPRTFLYHIKQVEKRFWGERFKVYDKWKVDWWEAFLKKGYFDTYTGFRCGGLLDRKQVSNYPIQGSAFHCLLWCLIQIQKILKKRNLKSVIIGQIHDSVLFDIFPGESKIIYNICKTIMTVKLRKHWPWLIVPIEFEFEISPSGKSWHEKEKYNG